MELNFFGDMNYLGKLMKPMSILTKSENVYLNQTDAVKLDIC